MAFFPYPADTIQESAQKHIEAIIEENNRAAEENNVLENLQQQLALVPSLKQEEQLSNRLHRHDDGGGLMNWFENIKKWYEAGFWTEPMVRNAVVKGKISGAVHTNHRTDLLRRTGYAIYFKQRRHIH